MSLKLFSAATASLFIVLFSPAVLAQDAAGETPASSEQAAARPAADKPARKKLFPDDVPGLQEFAIESFENGDYMRFIQANIKLREKRPYEQQYMIGMVVGAALLNKQNTAYNYMHVMQQQGLSYDFDATEDTESIRGTEVYEYLNGLLIEAGQPMGEAREAFTLPSSAVHPEAIAWDESRDRFLVGSIVDGSVNAVSMSGEIEALIPADDESGLLAITGIAVDEKHKRLWVSSAGVPGFAGLDPAMLGIGALFEFDLASLDLIKRHDIPADGLPHVPGNLAVTPSGDVYFIDRAVPMVFRKQASAGGVQPYVASKELTGLKDLALSDSGETLYIADGALGIMVIDLNQSTSAMLTGPESLNLGGISGLMFSDNSLVMMQNGINPQRIMRLELAPDGQSVTEVNALAIALPYFNAPAFGTVVDDAVFYFADGNQPGQAPEPGETLVLKTPLVLSEVIVPADYRKFQEKKAELDAKD